MPMSAAGLELLKKSEGFRGQMYLDVAGVPTIGYGHRILTASHTPMASMRRGARKCLAATCRPPSRP